MCVVRCNPFASRGAVSLQYALVVGMFRILDVLLEQNRVASVSPRLGYTCRSDAPREGDDPHSLSLAA